MSNNTGFRSLGPKVPKRVAINSSATSFTPVAGVTRNAICVVSLVLSASGAGNVVFNSGVTEIGSVEFKAADPPLVMGNNPDGWMETVIGEAFSVGNASALTLRGFLTYVEIGTSNSFSGT